MADDKQQAKRKRKSGSEKRRTGRRITVRLTPEDYADAAAAARAAGLTFGSYTRDCMLKAPKTQRRRRPSIETETLARLLGAVNRVGGNIHQLVKRVNFGETPLGEEIQAALADYREVNGAIMAALGRVKK